MADTCIVCLGDLAGAEAGPSDDVLDSKVELPVPSSNSKSPELPSPNLLNNEETIAHLLPCGHDLHHECLKPWVERANSCPICRQSFNEIELKNSVYGPTIHSYAVQDKRQVADIDPTFISDDLIDEPAVQPCMCCGRDDNEEILLLCDGCSNSCHTECIGLASVPAGSWFCFDCQEDRTISTQSQPRRRTNRTIAQSRAVPRQGQSPDPWARVWQSVWTNLNLDLDFPFDEERDEAAERARAQRREFHQWERRFRVAQHQGGAARFRDTASALLDRRTRSAAQSAPSESQEEIRAWNAFDKAREVSSSTGTSRRNKRKSPTASPVELPAPPERALKRPRARRTHDLPERPSARSGGPATPTTTQEQPVGSFFHSLLREVETSPSTPNLLPSRDPFSAAAESSPSSPSSPSSSAASPIMSPYSSPRSRSVSPAGLSPPLTSTILPVFDHNVRHSSIPTSPLASADLDRRKLNGDPNTADRTSPNKTNSAFERVRSTKAHIQSMVAAALQPAYHRQQIDKEQYTNINREISRRLYEQVGDGGGLTDSAKNTWESIAAREVDLAVSKLTDTKDPATAA